MRAFPGLDKFINDLSVHLLELKVDLNGIAKWIFKFMIRYTKIEYKIPK